MIECILRLFRSVVKPLILSAAEVARNKILEGPKLTYELCPIRNVSNVQKLQCNEWI